MQPRITISMPCYKRPFRTANAINCIRRQTVQDFEAIVIGDGCPVFEPVRDDPRFISFNTPVNYGRWGYFQTNYAIQAATGKYFVFMGNDDTILINHFENYLSAIEGTDLDFVWFPRIVIRGKRRRFLLKSGKIGHCALIIRTEFLKQMPPHDGRYNHDWDLLNEMIHTPGVKYKKALWKPATYHIDPYKWRNTENDKI